MDDFESQKVEKYQKKLTELKSKRQRRDFWGAQPGPKPNRIRVLPNWNGEPLGDFYRETAYHRKLGTEADKSAVCLVKEGFERCPVCEMVRGLYKTKNKEDADLAKTIKSQVRVLYNMIDLDSPEKGVQVWMSGVDILEQLLAYCGNPKYGDLTDPERGRNIDLFMAKNTKTGFNEYNVQPDPERTSINDPEWLGQMADLDALVKPMSVEELDALLKGLPVGEEKPEEKPEEEKAEAPGSRGPKPDKSCISKFSSDDPECLVCEIKDLCVEQKKAKLAPKQEPKVAEQPKVVEQPDKEQSKGKHSEAIKAMLGKVREDRKGKK